MARGIITDAEKARARQKHGTTKSCPRYNKNGDIDDLFGWRRLKPDDEEVVPQSDCTECRGKYHHS